ncbi:hypothetical protein EVAR_52571_1 [Eumeta japonica]|uniref:Reverse transcriptase domain-containing protein n=1 Tax=Eumeta variegata TaxID=151549 RepID=A0A4C1YDT2_EUMVA|nr:hypothetical protein EVAR_52571_1 [Eumeta japonica]
MSVRTKPRVEERAGIREYESPYNKRSPPPVTTATPGSCRRGAYPFGDVRPLLDVPTSYLFANTTGGNSFRSFHLRDRESRMKRRAGRSTIDAGVELVQYTFGGWQDSRDAIGVFCDLSKAFDCVSRETLVGKLSLWSNRPGTRPSEVLFE